jgi:thiamine-monophosphate kinase
VISEIPDQTIADLGEQQLLQRLYQYCDAEVVGDDAALLVPAPAHEVVVTTDMLVDGTHFSVGLAMPGMQTTTPFDVGWKSAAANLSDLAAMGAHPLGLTIALGLPPQLPMQFVAGFYQGMKVWTTMKPRLLGGIFVAPRLGSLASRPSAKCIPTAKSCDRRLVRET